MNGLELIHSRRSIRSFTDEPVSEEHLHAMLDAAMIAPSAGNAMPWHFVVIDDKALLERIPDLNPYAAMAPKSPVSILVCGNLALEKYQGFWVQDCSAAIQNLLLAATALGIGSVWTGIYPMEDRVQGFRELCGLPEDIVPLGLIVLGHPAQKFSEKSRFDAAKISRNSWTK